MPLTRTDRLNMERLSRNLNYLDDENLALEQVQAKVPEAWHTLEEDIEVFETKTKITLRLDNSVVKFYRAMGPGYQTRINRILATYAQMQIANLREAEAYMREDRVAVRETQRARMKEMRERQGLPPLPHWNES
ncbi:BrnA antitoxin family protein [Aliiroseovarius sp. PTFE2010]|uniref:BrnA antitoxin family protein n=1 Tax=Aliiroseovarius sp. PTFE2010 TaxID=3417190 RepID=UPI003CF9D1A1